MTVLTETIHQGEWLVSEGNGKISRDEVTVTVSGATKWLSGTVLGKITASGKYIKYDNGASDGSQAAAGILWNDPALGIDWPVPASGPILSDKDKVQPLLADFETPFD